MTKNPYATSEVGPLMRDVKNKICRTLDLHGFLEDDNGVELLVRNKVRLLISIDPPPAPNPISRCSIHNRCFR